MKKWIYLLGICLVCTKSYAQNFGIKSNILYDATTTINLGVEFALTDRWTLDISGNYNPWSFPQKKVDQSGALISQHDATLKHWMIQPEIRWWTCEKFHGHFFGLHTHYGQYNVGGLSFLPDGWADGRTDKNGVHHDDGVQHKRFEGWALGAGLSYGYHWILSNCFSLEFTIGGGYAYLSYDKYPLGTNQAKAGKYITHYYGPTKVGVSAVFMLK